MNKKIIFQNKDGGVCVISPIEDCGLTIYQIASKDVPVGLPYRVVRDADIPTDRTFRAAWEADFSNPDGYGLGHEAWLALQQEGSKL